MSLNGVRTNTASGRSISPELVNHGLRMMGIDPARYDYVNRERDVDGTDLLGDYNGASTDGHTSEQTELANNAEISTDQDARPAEHSGGGGHFDVPELFDDTDAGTYDLPGITFDNEPVAYAVENNVAAPTDAEEFSLRLTPRGWRDLFINMGITIAGTITNAFMAAFEAAAGILQDFIRSEQFVNRAVSDDEDAWRYIHPGVSVRDQMTATLTQNYDDVLSMADIHAREEAERRLRENMQYLGIDYADELFDALYENSFILQVLDAGAERLMMDRNGRIYGAVKKVDRAAEIALLLAVMTRAGASGDAGLQAVLSPVLNALVYGFLEIGGSNISHYSERLQRRIRDTARDAALLRMRQNPPTDEEYMQIAQMLAEAGLINPQMANNRNAWNLATQNMIMEYYFAQLQVEEIERIENSQEIDLTDEEFASLQLEGYLDGVIAAVISALGSTIKVKNHKVLTAILKALFKSLRSAGESALDNWAFGGENEWADVFIRYLLDSGGTAVGDILGQILTGGFSSDSSSSSSASLESSAGLDDLQGGAVSGLEEDAATATLENNAEDLERILEEIFKEAKLNPGSTTSKTIGEFIKSLRDQFPQAPDPELDPSGFLDYIAESLNSPE